MKKRKKITTTEEDSPKTLLAIDKHNLDEEVIRQPMLQYDASERYAYVVSYRDALKDDIKKLSAELYLQYRESLSKAETRVTETLIQANVDIDEELVALKIALGKAVLDVDKLVALKDAVFQRGFMLKELCSMYLHDYYAKEAHHTQAARDVDVAKNRELVRTARSNKG